MTTMTTGRLSLRCGTFVALALILAAAACAQSGDAQAPPSDLSDAEKIYGLSLFWQEVNYNFAFFDQVPDLDWDSAYQGFISRVLATESTYDYYRELQRFAALLDDGHTSVSMPRGLQDEIRRRDTYPWVLTENVEGRVLVERVGEALLDDIRLHSEIVRIDGRPAAEVAVERRMPFIARSTEHDRMDEALGQALYGPADDSVRIELVTPSGEERTLVLARDRRTRDDEWTPPFEEAEPFEMKWLEDDIAYVALNTFQDTMVYHGFEEALPELRGARGLVIDIRENGGGSSGMGYRVASWITDDTLETSAWRTREHRAAYKAWGQWQEQRRKYWEMDAWHDGGTHGEVPPADGERVIVPTAVLLGHGTFSAAEDFLVAVDEIPHVTTVGRRSGGSTGQPLVFELPGGGRARVVTKRDTYPDGRDFVGIGVIPDIYVPVTVEDVRAARDAALERAVEVVKGSVGSNSGLWSRSSRVVGVVPPLAWEARPWGLLGEKDLDRGAERRGRYPGGPGPWMAPEEP